MYGDGDAALEQICKIHLHSVESLLRFRALFVGVPREALLQHTKTFRIRWQRFPDLHLLKFLDVEQREFHVLREAR